jgi:hypothetical protein
MSSWGLLLALSGYSYSAPEMRLGFDPAIYPENFRTFWTTGGGWGTFSQSSAEGNSERLTVDVRYGEITLKEFAFSLPPSLRNGTVSSIKATFGGRSLKASFKQDAGRIVAAFLQPSRIKAGEKLELDILSNHR